MSYTQTPNYSLYKPTVNADNDQWGNHLNANADTIDTQLKTIANTAGVVSFNTRTGTVSLLNADVTTVLPPSSTTPVMDGTGTVGTGTTWARADHQHPSDTSRAPLASPVFTGDPQAPTAAAGDSDTSIATTAFVAAAVAPDRNNVGRNLIHNSMFNVAQRGAGPFTTQGYTLDRWVLTLSSDTASISQIALGDADRAGIGDEAATRGLQNVFTGNAAAGAFNFITQKKEGVRRLSVSFYAHASAALKLGMSIDQQFGSGGSPSADVNGNGQSVTLSTAWARYTLTFTLPSTTGLTLGTNGDDKTNLNLWYSSGTTLATRAGNIGVQSGNIGIWGIQLEIGSVATPLEKPDPRYDLANCQRFYHTGAFAFGGGGTVGIGPQMYQTFPVRMRASPTVVGNSSSYVGLSGGGVRASTLDGAGYLDVFAGTTTANAWLYSGTYTASADL
jgi:hypothetical protein